MPAVIDKAACTVICLPRYTSVHRRRTMQRQQTCSWADCAQWHAFQVRTWFQCQTIPALVSHQCQPRAACLVLFQSSSHHARISQAGAWVCRVRPATTAPRRLPRQCASSGTPTGGQVPSGVPRPAYPGTLSPGETASPAYSSTCSRHAQPVGTAVRTAQVWPLDAPPCRAGAMCT